MKSYTDLEQSKKLAEILPIESADMWWNVDFTNYPSIEENIGFYQESKADIPCWSLAPLRSSLPCGVNINNTLHVFESHNTFDGDWVYVYKFENSEPLYTKASNEIDACYEMIVKLHEQKLL